MWSAIKSDLYEFVATVQEEAQESLSKVVDIGGEKTSEEQEKITEEERILSEFRNKFSTYSEVNSLLWIHTFKFNLSQWCLKFVGCGT